MNALFEKLQGFWLAIREDAAFACRSLARVPTYTTSVLLTLALAIGGITAVFSVLYAVVLRPLPFPDARKLVALHMYYDRLGLERGPSSPAEFLDLQRQNRSFSKLAATSYGAVNVTGLDGRGQGEAVHVSEACVSVDFFRLLGLAPVLGRDFAPDDDQPGAPAVALLSASFHRRAFGGTADVIGKSIDIDGTRHTIIGVLPRAYEQLPIGYVGGTSPTPHDIWRPLTFDERFLGAGQRNMRYLQVFGRLRPEVTFSAASAELDRIVESFHREYPASYQRDMGFSMYLEPLQAYTGRLMGRVLWLLLGAVGLVLLAACANAASLSLARLATRRREIAVRAALGATAGRIAVQFLVESVIVALGAGVLGVVIGRAGMDGLLAVRPGSLSNTEVSFQLPVFAFALGVSGVTGIVAGAAPAWHAARSAPTSGLHEGGRATNSGAIRLRSALVVAQVTVALVLLVCAAMMLRSVVQQTTESPGFEPKDVYVGAVSLNKARYNDTADRRRFADQLLERLRSSRGVESVGLTNILPFTGSSRRKIQIDGDPVAPFFNVAQVRTVGGDYFTTLGVELVAGRFLAAADTREALKVAVISELTATKYFSGRNPLGMRLIFQQLSGEAVPLTIVGIVADSHELGMDKPVDPFVFVPFDQWPDTSLGVAVRAPRLGRSALWALAAAAAAVDPEQPFHDAKPLEELVDASLASRRFTLLLLSAFAALALSLAVLGIYGLTSYSVAQRAQELAIRMAMGADHVAIVRLILARAVGLVALGVVLGSLLSALAGRYLASQIYGLSAWDPEAAGVLATLLMLVATLAGWIPARRATQLPLAGALRTE